MSVDRRHDHFISRLKVQGRHGEMHTGCAARTGDGVRRSERCREVSLQTLDHGAAVAAETAAAQRLDDEVFFLRVERAACGCEKVRQRIRYAFGATFNCELLHRHCVIPERR